jgi:hypothetical protein
MKLEYYAYYPVVKSARKFYPRGDNPQVGITETRAALPQEIASEIMEANALQRANTICVESHKSEIVRRLDEVMELRKNNFSRRRHIEITDDEIDNYDYFFIDVRTMDWKRQVDYEVSRPTCTYEPCPWGAKRTSPTRIYSRRIRGVSIARICDIWDLGTRFIISERLRDLFDAAGVTGLGYEPCLVEHRTSKRTAPVVFADRLYVGQIRPSIAQRADRIYIHSYCRRHRVIISFDVCNLTTPEAHIFEHDFQMANRLVVGRKEYIYRHPVWFVSRKVLKILLEHARQDLRPRGYYLKQPFVPVPLEEPATKNSCSGLSTALA